jgi:hypothetical protein
LLFRALGWHNIELAELARNELRVIDIVKSEFAYWFDVLNPVLFLTIEGAVAWIEDLLRNHLVLVFKFEHLEAEGVLVDDGIVVLLVLPFHQKDQFLLRLFFRVAARPFLVLRLALAPKELLFLKGRPFHH